MSNPSLLCVPYRFKTSKLYSQIPDSGLGDFVVTRSASNSATRVNAAGLIETVADNVPRLDYPIGGITAGCPALLVEPSAQNQSLYSEQFDNAFNGKFNLNAFGSGSVANTTATRDPYGTNVADYIQENSVAGVAHAILNIFAGNVSGTTYTWSVFAKAAERTIINLFNNAGGGGSANFNLTTGVVTLNSGVSASMQNYGNGWWRCILTYTSSATGNHNVQIRLCDASGNTTYNGTGNQGAYIFGAQLEVGSVATSYIPTAASPVTRGAETISKTGVSSLIGQTEGTIYAEVDVRNLGISRSFMNVQDASYATNAVRIESQGNNWRIQIRAASATILDQTIASPAFTTGIYKVAFAYSAAANGVSFAVNGTIIYTNASALTMPSGMDRVHLGTRSTASPAFDLFLNDRIRAAAIYPTRLPNTGPISLQSLTQ